MPVEAQPTHFPSRDGSGLYGRTTGYPPEDFAVCVRPSLPRCRSRMRLPPQALGPNPSAAALEAARSVAALKRTPLPGLHSFPCAPIRNRTVRV